METPQIKSGSRVTLRPADDEIIVVSKYEKTGKNLCFTSTDGNFYHIKGHCPRGEHASPLYDIVSVESDPESWPPVQDDIWRAAGKDYHYLGDINPKFYTGRGRMYEYVSADLLKKKNPVLMYRSGR